MPKKQFFMTSTALESRQKSLENLLRALSERKDTCNSQLFVQFLNLDKFFPELIYHMPKICLKMQLPKKEQVTACEYIECFNIFILGIQVKNTSRLEVYAFQKGSDQLSFAARQSMLTDDRMSIVQTEKLERDYISEVYDTNDADFDDLF